MEGVVEESGGGEDTTASKEKKRCGFRHAKGTKRA